MIENLYDWVGGFIMGSLLLLTIFGLGIHKDIKNYILRGGK